MGIYNTLYTSKEFELPFDVHQFVERVNRFAPKGVELKESEVRSGFDVFINKHKEYIIANGEDEYEGEYELKFRTFDDKVEAFIDDLFCYIDDITCARMSKFTSRYVEEYPKAMEDRMYIDKFWE